MVPLDTVLRESRSIVMIDLVSTGSIMEIKYSPFRSQPNSVLTCCDHGLVLLNQSFGLGHFKGSKLWGEGKLHHNIVFALEWCTHDSILTGSADKSICEWVIHQGMFLKKAAFLKHSSGVKSLSMSPESPNCFVSGGRDGSILVWDKRCHSSAMNLFQTHQMPVEENGKYYRSPRIGLAKAHESFEQFAQVRKRSRSSASNTNVDSLNGITAVKWLKNDRILSTAAAHSAVLAWDIRMTPKTSMQCSETYGYHGSSLKRVGFGSLSVSPYEDFFTTTCTDNSIYEYNLNLSAKSEDYCRVYNNPSGASYFTKSDIDPTGHYFLSGSCENKAYIWKRGCTGEPIGTLSNSVHNGELQCVSWNRFDPLTFATGCEAGFASLWSNNSYLANIEGSHSGLEGFDSISGEIALSSSHNYFTENVANDVFNRRIGLIATRKRKNLRSAVEQTELLCPISPEKEIEMPSRMFPITTPSKPTSCPGLKDLPDFVRQTPNGPQSQTPRTPSTCPPAVSQQSDTSVLTPSPRKQFMSNFRSAFKFHSSSKQILSSKKASNKKSSQSPISSMSSNSKSGGNGGEQITPLKTENIVRSKLLSPIPEIFRLRNALSNNNGANSSVSSGANKENLHVKRKLEQF